MLDLRNYDHDGLSTSDLESKILDLEMLLQQDVTFGAFGWGCGLHVGGT